MKKRKKTAGPCLTVIFDFDGTLADSFSAALGTVNHLAPSFGYDPIEEKDIPMLRKMNGVQLLKHLKLPLRRLPKMVKEARGEIKSRMLQITLFPGIAQVLEEIKKHGMNLGIVTSNSEANVRNCLENNGVGERFDFIHSAPGLFGKHRLLKHLKRKLKISADLVVYVGDESRDIEASHRCDIPVIAVTWGFQHRDRLVELEPEGIAETPQELKDLLLTRFCKCCQ
ncbi:HAD hydrolase-like protein [Chitinispirillales bacterium ANBcel5]|uniref:HAD hydrolase-like protein n=1 Tax=Cellulosispirillum alkaliphilum TaxID=3039283 RepID=UPI002A537825|nr:HAD hydrolase-like protein [Chitinispirillales bacterium ANBcel5]